MRCALHYLLKCNICHGLFCEMLNALAKLRMEYDIRVIEHFCSGTIIRLAAHIIKTCYMCIPKK